MLKQLVAFVGEEAFFAGARAYFARHAYGNTTLEDLLVELEQASGRDMRAWAQAWLQTTGMSTLSLERGADGGAVVRQTDPRPHRLQIGLYDLQDGALVLRERIPLDIVEERTPVDLPEADLTLLNDGDLTYAKVRLDERSLRAVEQALSGLEDPLARALVWSALWNATRDGELSVARYLDVVAAHAPGGDRQRAARRRAAERAVRDRALSAARRPRQGARGLDRDHLGGPRRRGSGERLPADLGARVRRRGRVRRCPPRRRGGPARGVAPAGLPLDPDLRWALLTALVTTGHAGAEQITAEQLRDRTATGRTAALAAAASTPNAEVRAADWRGAWTDLSLTNDHLDATIAGFGAGGRRDLIEGFDAEYFDRIGAAWAERSIEIASRLVRGLYPDADTTALVDAWLAENPETPAALRRLVEEQRDHQQRAIRVRAAQAALR